MEDAPNIDVKSGQGGRLVYDKERRTIVAVPSKARLLREWHEDDGPVLWWSFPVREPPYIGTPIDCPRVFQIVVAGKLCGEFTHGGWPGYHTHWTPLPEPPTA